jgi:hypothetical protein
LRGATTGYNPQQKDRAHRPALLMFRRLLASQTFGHLTVTSYAGVSKHGEARWRCRCECGRRSVALGSNLRKRHTSSCGCKRRDIVHGEARRNRTTSEYRAWQAMKQRCFNANTVQFHRYGGRGIKIAAPLYWEDRRRQDGRRASRGSAGYVVVVDRLRPYCCCSVERVMPWAPAPSARKRASSVADPFTACLLRYDKFRIGSRTANGGNNGPSGIKTLDFRYRRID